MHINFTWTKDHEEYMESFKIVGYPQEDIDQYRNELECHYPDRVEDYCNWLEHRHSKEYKDAMHDYATYPMLGRES